MTEEVKRLKIADTVLRELYIFSGNQCAFPGCSHNIVNEDGTYIAQICHIEAASEGGQRFNSSMTNDDRRALSNLMLLCYEHHKTTDNTEIYTVEKMQEMKANHEGKFKNLFDDMNKRLITDITKKQEFCPPNSLTSINNVLKWGICEEDLQGTIEGLTTIVNQSLQKIIPEGRIVFCTMLERLSGKYILLDEIQGVLNLTSYQMGKNIDELIKYGLITEPFQDYFFTGCRGPVCEVKEMDPWDKIWSNLKEYCNITGIKLEELIVNLKFDLLD
ncbi:TPA: HNH endonuclease [Bacillus cereus]|nr:HNH endonuclease [Bacillus cereus]